MNRIERAKEEVNKIPFTIKLLRKNNTLEDDLKYHKDLLKENLYKILVDAYNAPDKISKLEEMLKNRTEQRDKIREDNKNLREELKIKDSTITDYEKKVTELNKTIKVLEKERKIK